MNHQYHHHKETMVEIIKVQVLVLQVVEEVQVQSEEVLQVILLQEVVEQE